MKSISTSRIPAILAACLVAMTAWGYVKPTDFPFAPAAGEPGTTAIAHDDPVFVGWATGFIGPVYGTDVDATWQTPARALGPAGTRVSDIVCLGRGGEIVLTFLHPIRDGAGPDFAVFENGFSAGFLELAWVEVSTDGTHFVRFPDYSATPGPVPGYGSIDPDKLHGYASKYELGYGTPFDLTHLVEAHADVLAGTDPFSDAYRQHLLEQFPKIDVQDIRFVRLIDIIGDGSARSAARDPEGNGFIIYDMFPTTGSAGVDIDAIGVINQVDPEGLPQSILFGEIAAQRLDSGGIHLEATASSGLAVAYAVLEGPATVSGNQLGFTGKGTVVVQARQPGNGTYAPATPVTRSFIVADAVQHIFIEPVPNQLVGSSGFAVQAYASSGLPVYLQVFDGPVQASVGIVDHQFSAGPETGPVTLLAFQPGDETHAPAEDVLMSFSIVEGTDPDAPVTFADYALANGLSGDPGIDSDQDGTVDGLEFRLAGDPNSASLKPDMPFTFDGGDALLSLTTVLSATGAVSIHASGDLLEWEPVVPEILSQTLDAIDGKPVRHMTLRIQKTSTHQFWRVEVVN